MWDIHREAVESGINSDQLHHDAHMRWSQG